MPISCVNQKKPSSEKNDVEKVAVNSASYTTENVDSVLYPTLQRIIEDLTFFYDSVLYKNDRPTHTNPRNIYRAIFGKKGNDCFITISVALVYRSYELRGYTILNNKMLVFSNPENECNCGLIDTTKMSRNIPVKGYGDENSDLAYNTFDPIGRRYKIHNKDSLELVFTGNLDGSYMEVFRPPHPPISSN